MRRLILLTLAGLAVPALAAAQVEYLATYQDTTDAAFYTFPTVDIGTAASDRMIIVVAYARKSSGGAACEVPGVEINGVSAPPVVSQCSPSAATTSNNVAISTRLIGGGTTISVELNYSGVTHLRSAIAVYRANIGTTTLPSTFATGSSLADDPTGTLTIPAIGIAVGGSMSSASGTVAWTGLTEAVEVAAGDAASTIYSGAMRTTSTLLTSQPILADWSAATHSSGVWASWQAVTVTTTTPVGLPTLTVLGVGAEP